MQNPDEVDRCMAMTDPKLFYFSPDTAYLYLAGCDVVRALDKHKNQIMLADTCGHGRRWASHLVRERAAPER